MDTDRNLLFGELALQADWIDSEKFSEACAAWTARKDGPRYNAQDTKLDLSGAMSHRDDSEPIPRS